MDMDVYDGAAWSVVTELSERSNRVEGPGTMAAARVPPAPKWNPGKLPEVDIMPTRNMLAYMIYLPCQ